MEKTTTFHAVVTLLFSLLLLDTAAAQPFAIGNQSLTFNDPARDRDIPVEIYYPADIAGDNVEITQTPGQFPAIAFCHGFVMGFDAYLYLRDLLVPQGFILIFPKTEGGLAPSHLEFGLDMAFCLQQIKALGLDDTSIYSNRIAPENAVMGHSMGGGAAFLAASSDADITAIAVLAPAETNPSAITAAGTLQIPALVLAGGNDCVTPPSSNQVPMYNELDSACKTYINVIGGSHCQMADPNFLCSFGELTCSPDPDISREVQLSIVAGYASNWLKARLKNDCEAGSLFDNQLATDSAVAFEKTCDQCEPLLTNANAVDTIVAFPNPVADTLTITLPADASVNFTLYDAQGRKIIRERVIGNQINMQSVTAGCYFYTISSNDSVLKKGKIVKY